MTLLRRLLRPSPLEWRDNAQGTLMPSRRSSLFSHGWSCKTRFAHCPFASTLTHCVTEA